MTEKALCAGARSRRRIVVGVGLAVFLNTALAHHSFAIFDAKKSLILHGVVKQFLWTNPHVFIQLMADGEAGAAATEWSIEMSSPEHLVRAGWKPGTLKSGDPVTLVIHPVIAIVCPRLIVRATLSPGRRRRKRAPLTRRAASRRRAGACR